RWNGKQTTLETTLVGHDNAVQALDFHPDGKTLVSGSSDRTVILWTKHSIRNPDDLIGHGCSWIGDYLNHNRTVTQSDRDLCDGIGQRLLRAEPSAQSLAKQDDGGDASHLTSPEERHWTQSVRAPQTTDTCGQALCALTVGEHKQHDKNDY
ncbi:MAG: hypothetical protein AAFY50_25260, partial [Cyanobacteria bacterium J06648_1]